MSDKLSSVSFFCPAYHDEGNLPLLIPKVHAFLSDIAHQFEIVIIEDGSPDKTGEVADKLAQEYSYTRVIHHQVNKGYGATLREGFQTARYEYVVYTDGDNQYNIDELRPYIDSLNTVDILSPYVSEKAVSFRRKVQSMVYNALIVMLYGVYIRDINCSLKLYKRRVIESMPISSTSAFIDAEMLIRARRAGYKIMQFPVTHYRRATGLASGSSWKVVSSTIGDMISWRIKSS